MREMYDIDPTKDEPDLDYRHHPAYGANDCVLRGVVRPKTDITTKGYNCAWTGAHCIPCDDCGSYRKKHKKQQEKLGVFVHLIAKEKGEDND